MNVFALVKGDLSSRFFALVTIVSLVLSALPVAFFVANAANTDAVGNVTVKVLAAPSVSNGEYFAVSFSGTGTLNLDGWTVADAGGVRHTFGATSLLSGNTYKVCQVIGVATGCDVQMDSGASNVWNNTGDTLTLKDETSATVLQVAIPNPAGSDVEYTNTEAIDYTPEGTVRNVEDDIYFATVQAAIAAASTGAGETIELTADIDTASQIRINKEIALDGNGFMISSTFTKTDNGNNSVINIFATDNVTVKDLAINGSGGTNLHGVNLYESSNVLLQNLTIKNNDYSAVVVNRSTATIDTISTSGNGEGNLYAVIDISGNGETAAATIIGASTHTEPEGKAHVLTVEGTSSTFNDSESQYVNNPVTFNSVTYNVYRLGTPVVKDEATVVVTGNTSAGENQSGWLFNRDLGNATPIEFNTDEKVIGTGSLYVLPLSNTIGAKKFIGEYFWGGAISDLDGFSYDYKIGAGGEASDENQFYLNVYANFGESSATKYYDCKYDVVPTVGSIGGFTTITFDPTQPYPVTKGTQSWNSPTPYDCPAVPADMDNLSPGSFVRAFAINAGDTSLTDADLDGYFDKVVLDTKTEITTFDFEPVEQEPEEYATVQTTKIVCANEEDLPNWGKEENGAPAIITNTTATDWLAANPQVDCAVDAEWEFEWADVSVPKPNQYNTYLGSAAGWNTFSGSTLVPLSALNGKSLELREVIPVTGGFMTFGNKNENSPEFYCHEDLLNYDNLERVNKPLANETYNCVAWNVLPNSDPQNQNQLNISGEVYLDIAVDDCDNRTECLFSRTNTQLAGWEMRLYKEGVGGWFEVATSSTDAEGIYKFATQQKSGVYHTCEVLKSGYEQGMGNWNGSGYLVNTPNLSEAADEGPYCNTYTYTDLEDKSSKSHFGNAAAVVPVPQCTVDIKSSTATIVVESNDYAVETYNENNRWTASIPGATWIWNTLFVEDTEVSTTKTFKETFTATNISDATLNLAADNTYKLYLNGQLVVDNTQENNYSNFSQDSYSYAELGGYLQDGENTLEVEVTNLPLRNSSKFSNPAGALFNLVVTAEEGCAVTTEPEVIIGETPDTFMITGTKYTSVEGAESAPYAGYEITLSQGEFSQSTTTDINGEYYFEVEAGDWVVSETLGDNWTQDSVLQNGNEVTTESAVESCDFAVTDSVESVYNCDFYNSYTEPVVETPVVDPPAQRRSSNSGGTRTLRTASPAPLVLGASTSMCPFLTEFMQIGDVNNSMEVTKLQLFLNIFKNVYGGTDNPVTGAFGAVTDANVKTFQEYYRTEVLDPWFEKGIVPHDRPTGFVYKTTLWKINSLVCPEAVYPSFEGEDLTNNVDND